MSRRKLAVTVGLLIASTALVATVLSGKTSAISSNTGDLDTVIQLTSEDPCADFPQIKISDPIHNNLGRKGPDTGAEGIVYPAVDLEPGHPPEALLLVVNATNELQTDPRANGRDGKYARLTARGGSHIDATFKILKANTLEPAILRELDITFFDLDTHSSGSAVEYVELKGFSQYFLTGDTELKVAKDGDFTKFKASTVGTAGDNPKDPLLLTVQQKNRAVTVKYEDIHKFDVKLGVDGEGGGGNHRWFNFVLRPSLLCAKTKDGDDPVVTPVGETKTTTSAPPEETTTAEAEDKKCLFVVPIINWCFPKFW